MRLFLFFSTIILMLLVTFSICSTSVISHSPLGGLDNDSLETASEIPDPTKSWALYSSLEGPETAQYYVFEINAGERIHVTLQISPSPANSHFTPNLVIMGPGIANQGTPPPYLEIANGSGVMITEGIWPMQAYYEGFSPSTFYQIAQISLAAPSNGTYYIAVYGSDRGGQYGLAVGDRESFTLQEWIQIPFSLIGIYQWEGQSLLFVMAPMAAMVLIGLILTWKKLHAKLTPFTFAGSIAGFMFIGTALTTLAQMVFVLTITPAVPEVAITLMFALLPAILGYLTLRQTLLRKKNVDTKARIYLAVLGTLAIFAWAGLLVGPAIALAASALPSASVASKENR